MVARSNHDHNAGIHFELDFRSKVVKWY